MQADEDLIRRWKANAAAAGVTLTDDDIARIDGRGQLGRIRNVEAIIERTRVRHEVPDYLSVLDAEEPADG